MASAEGRYKVAAITLLCTHCILLAWSGYRHSPTIDEIGHLPAGLHTWIWGGCELYYVNPPLVKVVAALPVLLMRPEIDLERFIAAPPARPEWAIGRHFIAINGPDAFFYFAVARWACIPFSVIGGVVCFRWARELYGLYSGLCALCLWCFSPTVLGNAALITPDVAAASCGLLAHYLFWRWLVRGGAARAMICGIGLGVAELAKMTWIVLFVLWPVMWWVYCRRDKGGAERRGGVRVWCQFGGIFLVALFVINAAYGFRGSFRQLGSFTFFSEALAGTEAMHRVHRAGNNRFADDMAGLVPVPLPASYVAGIDLQKLDFEEGKWSYLAGEHRLGGWWYWYLYALAVKVPVGTWMLLISGVAMKSDYALSYTRWRDEMIVVSPAIVVLAFVSAHVGFSRYFRYVLPCLPFAFVWASRVMRRGKHSNVRLTALGGLALAWSSVSSLLVYPHSMSYFNELAGGPKNGHSHLIDGNIDWGQDLLYLKEWYAAHPEARPIGIAHYSAVGLEHFGIQAQAVPRGPARSGERPAGRSTGEVGPVPGWFVVSVHRLHDRSGAYQYFLQFKPVARIGYSLCVYHIGVDEANRVRRELGLQPLSSGP